MSIADISIGTSGTGLLVLILIILAIAFIIRRL